MNAKLLFKTVFLLVVLLLLVLMGVNNRSTVSFALQPLISQPVRLPGAVMYFAFFAVGLLTGTILAAGGGGGKKSGGAPSRSSKGEK